MKIQRLLLLILSKMIILKKTLNYTLFFILITIIVYQLNNYRSNLISDHKQEINKLKIKVDTFKEIIISHFRIANLNVGVKLSPNIVIEDSSLKYGELSEIKKNNNLLILRISEAHCESCVLSSLQSLNIANSFLHNDNVVILGSYQRTGVLTKFLSTNKSIFNYYNLRNVLEIDAEEYGLPYFIVLNNDFEITSCYFPDKLNPSFTIDYLKGLMSVINN